MSRTYYEQFENLWEIFISKFKGSLTVDFKNQKISYPLLKIALNDAKSSWESRYDEAGVWMANLMEEHPEKGNLVRKILTEDMKFTEFPEKKPLPPYIGSAAGLAGGAAGYFIAQIFTNNWILKGVASAVPFAMIVGAVKVMEKKSASACEQKMINDYIAQLDKYKNSVCSVLQSL